MFVVATRGFPLIRTAMYFPAFKKLFTDPWSWRKTDFFRHTSTLVGGVGLAQMIPFLLSPVISRLYFPEDYAVLAAYTSLTVLLSVVATGMYSSALMTDKTDREAVNTAMAAFLVSLTVAAISLFVVLLFRVPLAGLTGNVRVLRWLFFLPLTVLFAGGSHTLMIWNNRRKRYRRLALNRVVQAVTLTGVTLALGFAGYRHSGLLVGLLSGQGAAFVVLLTQTWASERTMLQAISASAIKSAFRRHVDFPKYNMPQGFLDGIRESGILIIISNYFGAAVLGSFSFAMSILNKPLQLVGQPVTQVFYQQAAEKHQKAQSIRTLTRRTILMLFVLFLPVLILFVGWGEPVFSWVFGDNWSTAGGFAQILILWMLFRFVNAPLSTIPLILKRQRTFFWFGAVNNISLPLALLLCGLGGYPASTGMLVLTILGCLNMLAQIIWITSLNKNTR